MNKIYTDGVGFLYCQNGMVRIQFGDLETDEATEITPHTELIVSVDSFLDYLRTGNDMIKKMTEAGVFADNTKKKTKTRKKKTEK